MTNTWPYTLGLELEPELLADRRVRSISRPWARVTVDAGRAMMSVPGH